MLSQRPGAFELPISRTLIELEPLLQKAKKPLWLFGGLTPKQSKLAYELGKISNWPVIPELQSGLRFCDLPQLLPYTEWMLSHPKNPLKEADLIIQISQPVLSKKLLAFLKESGCHIYINENQTGYNPVLSVQKRYEVNLIEGLELLSHFDFSRDLHWPDFSVFNSKILKEVENLFQKEQSLTEPSVSYWISKKLDSQHNLFVSNSMPIRDLAQFGIFNRLKYPHVYANRGANGIDGIISTAVGCSYGNQKPTTLLVGDLAFLHDINGLSLIKDCPYLIQLIVINNHGGGIFSFLPMAENKKLLDPFMSTPQHHSLKHAAQLFGLSYRQPHSIEELEAVFQEGIQIIEIETSRAQNKEMHEMMDRHIFSLPLFK